MRFVPVVLLFVALSAWIFGFAVTMRSQNQVISDNLAKIAIHSKDTVAAQSRIKPRPRRRRRATIHAGAGFPVPSVPEAIMAPQFQPEDEAAEIIER